MDFQKNHEPFQIVAQWHIWRLGLDLSAYADVPLPGLPRTAGLAWYRFFQDILADLFTHSEAYGIPQESYETYVPGDKEQEDRIREARLKARKAIEVGLIDFLYQIGQSSEPDGLGLRVNRSFFEQLVAEKIKKTKNKTFLQGFDRLGLQFTSGEEEIISNTKYPGSLEALSRLAKECATIIENGFYFFRRCDFSVLSQKRLPEFDSALRLLPERLRSDVRHTDILLSERKFKREILVGDAAAGYRMRYQKKNGKIVYWCRIMSWLSPDIHHNLRWDFASDVTSRLFDRLEVSSPGLSDRIFAGIKKCQNCYDNCKVRVRLERHGVTQDCCSEAGWDSIGDGPIDFENLRMVLGILDEEVG